jgi:hypothetical protein
MTHDEARVFASARADGELADTAALDAHLTECADCAAYAADLDRLRVLTAALPRTVAPQALPGRVARQVRRRRWTLRLLPAVAAATTAFVAVSVLPAGPASFPLPPAAAAEGLLAMRSLYVERTVTAGDQVTRERIWWRAPGYLRVERSDGSVEVTRPDTGPPRITLPEPLSPTVALFGRDTGPGPVVAGRATRRYDLAVGGERRVAYVDAASVVVLGGRESVILSKVQHGPLVKTTQVVRFDVPVPDSLFAGSLPDGGFRSRPLHSLAVAPRRAPRGFALVRAGHGPAGDAALYARGSLPILVEQRTLDVGPNGEARSVVRAGVTYPVVVDLYAPPSVQLTTRRGTFVVTAPLPLGSLVQLATEMYRE